MKTVEPDSADSPVFECDFDEPPEKVWRALTEPDLLEAWLTKDTPRRSNSTDCEIVSAEPHRRLCYRWRDREAVTGDTERTLDRDHFMTAAEAKEWGVVDHVYSSRTAFGKIEAAA